MMKKSLLMHLMCITLVTAPLTALAQPNGLQQLPVQFMPKNISAKQFSFAGFAKKLFNKPINWCSTNKKTATFSALVATGFAVTAYVYGWPVLKQWLNKKKDCGQDDSNKNTKNQNNNNNNPQIINNSSNNQNNSKGFDISKMNTKENTKEFRWSEIRKHGRYAETQWVVCNGMVYDITKFKNDHAGGADILLENAGTDVTVAMENAQHSDQAYEQMAQYKIGVVKQ